MLEVRQIKKKSKVIIQRRQRTPRLGEHGEVYMQKANNKGRRGQRQRHFLIPTIFFLVSGYSQLVQATVEWHQQIFSN